MNEIIDLYPDYDPLTDPVVQEEYENYLDKEQENERSTD